MVDATTKALVQEGRVAVASKAVDLTSVVRRVTGPLLYLCSPEGRTGANCRFVDFYFLEYDDWSDRRLPEALHDIFTDMSEALHAACSAPDVGRNFDSTPEPLLERLRRVNTERGAAPMAAPPRL
jgi:hypothetical protein